MEGQPKSNAFNERAVKNANKKNSEKCPRALNIGSQKESISALAVSSASLYSGNSERLVAVTELLKSAESSYDWAEKAKMATATVIARIAKITPVKKSITRLLKSLFKRCKFTTVAFFCFK